jgi:condensin-2 complex subunit G2
MLSRFILYNIFNFQGAKYVLDNRLCHPLLKSLLPSLKNLLHDTSEQVRIAFLDLLLKVKGMRSIKVCIM